MENSKRPLNFSDCVPEGLAAAFAGASGGAGRMLGNVRAAPVRIARKGADSHARHTRRRPGRAATRLRGDGPAQASTAGCGMLVAAAEALGRALRSCDVRQADAALPRGQAE